MTHEALLYPIPHKYFPGVKVKQSFHAEVEYKVVAKKVIIVKVTFTSLCLQHITNTAALMAEMKEIIQATEDKTKRSSHVPNTIMSTLAPFINY